MAVSESIGELFVNITANTKEFNKAVDNTKKETEKFSKNIGNATKAIKGLIAGVSFGLILKGVKDLTDASIDAATQAEEINNKFGTAFDGIETAAQDTADALADNYGLASDEAKSLLSNTGDLIKGFGATATEALTTSDEIQRLAVDLASYNDLQGGSARASEILTKAFLGERDSLVSLGIKISEADVKQRLLEKGQEDLTGQSLLLAKGQATLELAFQQSGDAQGDYERSIGSAKQATIEARAATRDLQVELGTALLPVTASVNTAYANIVSNLVDWIRETNNLREAQKGIIEGEGTLQQKLTVTEKQYSILLEKLKEEREVTSTNRGRARQRSIERQIQLQDELSSVFKVKQQIEAQIAEEQRLAEEQRKKREAEQKAIFEAEQAEKKRQLAYEQSVKGIEEIIDTQKTEIELIEDQIAVIQELDAQDEETKQKQLNAIAVLNAQRQALHDEDLARQQEAQKTFQKGLDEEIKLLQEKTQEEVRLETEAQEEIRRQRELTQDNSIAILDNFLTIAQNVNKSRLEDGKKTAEEAYKTEVALFNAQKALTLIEIAVNTAREASKVLANPFLFGSTIALGAVQAAAVVSQPPPPAPAFAQGGVVTAPTRAIVGEDRGEVMIGMGAQGAPLLDELANRIGDSIQSNGGSKTVININSLYPPRQQDLDRLFRDGYQSLVKEEQRRGIKR